MSLIHATNANFKEEVKDYKGVALVDFWAPWCGPCQMIGPSLEELAEEMDGKAKIVKVNVDEEGSLGQEYQIMSIPAVFVFKDGEVVEKIIGARAKDDYKEAIEKNL